MAKPAPSPRDRDPLHPAEPGGARSLARALFVTSDASLASAIESTLAIEGLLCRSTSIGELESMIGPGTEPLIIIADENLTSDTPIVRELALAEPERCGVIVLSRRHDLDAAVGAMRAGAIDFIVWPCDPRELAARIRAGLERLGRLRDQTRRVDRLERACARLNAARREMSSEVDSLCNDLAGAYDELVDQVSTTAMSSEFRALVQQELDVESLLRTTLEYLLTRTGPTNAAVFLPTGHEDYSLGAYVNFDVPREAADVLLDHLADVIAPRFDTERGMRRFATESALREALEDDAAWLLGSELVVFACHDEDECIAVFALFRERACPFNDEILSRLEVMRDIFGAQLAKVVRIHHRHLPMTDEYPGFDIDSEGESGGMAA